MPTSSFTLFQILLCVWFSFNFHILLLTICFLLTIFVRTFLHRSMTTSWCWSSPWNHFHIPYILSIFFFLKYIINFCLTSTCTISEYTIASDRIFNIQINSLTLGQSYKYNSYQSVNSNRIISLDINCGYHCYKCFDYTKTNI